MITRGFHTFESSLTTDRQLLIAKFDEIRQINDPLDVK